MLRPDIQTVLTFARNSRQKHWKVYYGYDARNGGVALDSGIFLDPNPDIESSMAVLSKNLELLPPGEYLIHMKEDPKDKNDIVKLRFTIVQSPVGTTGIAGYGYSGHQMMQVQERIPAGYVSSDVVEARLKELETRLTSQFQIQTMQQQLKELTKQMKEGASDGIGSIIKEIRATAVELGFVKTPKPAVKVGVAGLQSGNVPGVQQPAQEQPQNTNQPTQEQLELAHKYNNVLKSTLKELDESVGGVEERIVLLYCLNEFRKDQPSVWESVLPQLEQYKKPLYELGIISDSE